MHGEMTAIYRKKFGYDEGLRFYFSPGRVNLIGEHIDYNGGHVLPAAISAGNTGAIGPRTDGLFFLYSENFANAGVICASLDNLSYRSRDRWANYAKGVIREFVNRGLVPSHGFNIAIHGNLPSGAGLSSSASIEMLVATMVNDMFGCGFSPTDLALLSQKVENEYICVKCGIMDQFTIANGKAENVLLLDTATLDYSLHQFPCDKYSVVVCNTKKRRGLSGSKYNERRRECERALSFVNRFVSAKDLCSITPEAFDGIKDKFTDETLLKRTRHAVTENARVMEACRLLDKGDIPGFASLFNKSHESLRDDFAVSCPELDYMVSLANENGSLGSRMTGAGFGGSTVNIIPKDAFDGFSKAVSAGFTDRFGVTPDIILANPSDGVREIL